MKGSPEQRLKQRTAEGMTVSGVDIKRDGIPDVLMQSMTVTSVDINRDGIPDVSVDEDAPFTYRTVTGDDSSEESDRDSGRSIITDALMAELFDNAKQEDRQVEEGSSPRKATRAILPGYGHDEKRRESECFSKSSDCRRRNAPDTGGRRGARDGWSWAKDGWFWAKDGGS